jgi:hypothetical protein
MAVTEKHIIAPPSAPLILLRIAKIARNGDRWVVCAHAGDAPKTDCTPKDVWVFTNVTATSMILEASIAADRAALRDKSAPETAGDRLSGLPIDHGAAPDIDPTLGGVPIADIARGRMEGGRIVQEAYGQRVGKLANQLAHPNVDRVFITSAFGATATRHAATRGYVIAMIDWQARRTLAIDLADFGLNSEIVKITLVATANLTEATITDTNAARRGLFLVSDLKDAIKIRVRLQEADKLTPVFEAPLDPTRHRLFDAQEALLGSPKPTAAKPAPPPKATTSTEKCQTKKVGECRNALCN